MPDEPAVSVLTLDIERTEDATVVRCRGELITGATDILFYAVRPMIPTTKRIVLDLTDLTYMDSTGLGILVRLFISARTAGCEFQLFNLSKRIRELLSLTNLLSSFSIIGENNIRIG